MVDFYFYFLLIFRIKGYSVSDGLLSRMPYMKSFKVLWKKKKTGKRKRGRQTKVFFCLCIEVSEVQGIFLLSFPSLTCIISIHNTDASSIDTLFAQLCMDLLKNPPCFLGARIFHGIVSQKEHTIFCHIQFEILFFDSFVCRFFCADKQGQCSAHPSDSQKQFTQWFSVPQYSQNSEESS